MKTKIDLGWYVKAKIRLTTKPADVLVVTMQAPLLTSPMMPGAVAFQGVDKVLRLIPLDKILDIEVLDNGRIYCDE